MDIKKVFSILKREQAKPVKKKKSPVTPYQRAFRAAFNSRFVDWIFTSSHKVNADLISQLKTLIERSRDLSQNNQIFRSYLGNCQRGIVGAEGFRLQMQIKNEDGTLNQALNDQIQWAWDEFNDEENMTVNGHQSGFELDLQILRTLLVDGEVFIRIVKDSNSPFGVKFKHIDTLAVDCLKNQPMAKGQNGIFNGVEVDHNYKPVKYYIRECVGFGNYESGQLEVVPADQIIHIYRSQFCDQVRGYSPIVASYDSLKQLDDFAVAELIAAKIASCQGIFYQRNDKTPTGDFLDQQNMDDHGNFLRELSPGMASIVPAGYNVKTLTPNHPSSNYDAFTKAITKRVASSIGTNYNTINGDLQAVNYSSLRQANIAQNSFYKLWQRFIIQKWKNKQFKLFLKGYLINGKTELKPSLYKKYLRSFRFISKSDPSYDIAKEMVSIERMLKLGLTSHIQEIQKRGLDPQEIVKDEVKWRALCDENGLPYNFYETNLQATLNQVDNFNSEANGNEDMQEN